MTVLSRGLTALVTDLIPAPEILFGAGFFSKSLFQRPLEIIATSSISLYFIGMYWIFLSLALVDVLLLFGVAATGFLLRDGFVLEDHVALGTIGSVFTLFVHCLVFVYFMGSGKSLNEAILRNGLDPALIDDLPLYRRKAFLRAWLVSLLAVATGILGAGVWSGMTPGWIHLTLAFTLIVVNLVALPVQLKYVALNGALVARIEALLEARSPEEPELPVEEHLGLIPLGKGLVITGCSVWALFAYLKWIMKEPVQAFPWFALVSAIGVGSGIFLMVRERGKKSANPHDVTVPARPGNPDRIP